MSLIDKKPDLTKRDRISRGSKRREEIACVAQSVFLELGYAETTMQIIALRAKASKETLYRHFTSKEVLFAEIVHTRAALCFDRANDELLPVEDPKKALFEIGYNLHKVLVSEDSLSLCRVVISEAPRNPELGRIFFEQGPAQIRQRLKDYLTKATQNGHLNCKDPALAAVLFVSSVVGNRHLTSLVYPEFEDITEEKTRLYIEEAVTMFLARYSSKYVLVYSHSDRV